MIICFIFTLQSCHFHQVFSFFFQVLDHVITYLIILGCLLMFKGEEGGGQLIESSEDMGEASYKEMGVASMQGSVAGPSVREPLIQYL